MAAKVKALQEWCRRQCDGYRDVNITNMTSSWKSGLAFCAMIHRYRPDLIDYDSLSKEDVYENNKLAFDVAREKLGIPALLDPEDMVIMTVPDKLCIVTYVAQYYNYFHNKPQDGGPGVRVGVKRQSIREQIPVSGGKDSYPPDAKKSAQHAVVDEPMQIESREKDSVSRRGGTLEDRCQMCHNKVYLLERHMTPAGRLYHRHCYRGYQRNSVYKKVPEQKENVTPDSMCDASSSVRNVQGNKDNGCLETLGKPDSEKPGDAWTPVINTKGGLSAGYTPLASRQPDKTKTETLNAVVTKPTVGISAISEVKSVSITTTASSASGLLRSLYNVPSYKTITTTSSGFSLNGSSNADHGSVQSVTSRSVEPSSPRTAISRSNGAHINLPIYSIATTPVSNTVTATPSNTSAFSSSNWRFTPETSITSARVTELSVVSENPGSGRTYKTIGNSNVPFSLNNSIGVASASPINVPKGMGSGVTLKTISISSNPLVPPTTSLSSPVSTVSTFSNFVSSSSDKPKYAIATGATSKSSAQRYTTPPVVASVATSFLKSTLTSVAPLSDTKYSVNTFSTKSSNVSVATTGLSSTAGRSGVTSVTSSSSRPFSSTAKFTVLTDKEEVSAGRKTADLSMNYTSSSTVEVKSHTGDIRVREKDRELVTGLLQRLAEVRNDKLVTPITAGSSSPSYSPKVLSCGTAGIGATQKPILQTLQTQPVTCVVSSTKSYLNSYAVVTCMSVTKTVVSTVASSNSKTEWQLEAERRAAARSGGYIDPEKQPKKSSITISSGSQGTSQPSQVLTTGLRSSIHPTSQHSQVPATDLGSSVIPTVTVTKQSALLEVSPKTNYTRPQKPWEKQVKDIVPIGRPDETVSDKMWLPVIPSREYAADFVISSVVPENKDVTMITVRHQIVLPSQPSPSVVPHKVTDSSEPALPVDEILGRLEELDKQLQVMELEGRELEEKIRSGSDDAMDEDKDSIMGKWFDLIKQRNELVREESYLMYKRRQQELEQLHEELEYQLRCLLDKPEEIKTPEDKRLEEELLSELVETVSLRSAIVDSIEVDRLRYLEEDQKLEAMMANSSISESKAVGKKKNSKLKKKSQTFAETQEAKIKTKKKLFKFTSMKKSKPKTDTDGPRSSWYAADVE